MSTLKYNSVKALADHLGAAIPALAGNTHALQQPPQGIAQYPALAVLPESFQLVTQSSNSDLFDGAGTPLVDDSGSYQQVGRLSGSLQIWLAADYPAQREELEGAILQVFLGTDAPGRILLNIDTRPVSTAVPYTQPVAYHLEDGRWREEFAFSERRWAIQQVQLDLPLRVAFADAPVVETYIAEIETDLGADSLEV